MLDLLMSLLVVALLFASAFAGHWTLRLLPETHRSDQTMEFTKLASGLLVTFTALVLSLLISSVHQDFKQTDTDLRKYASIIIRLDAELANLRPASLPIQSALRRYTAATIASTWPNEVVPSGQYPSAANDGSDIDSDVLGDLLHKVETEIRELVPANMAESLAQTECLTRMETLLDQRWALVSEAHSSVTPPFFAVMMFWLAIVFVSFGMVAPPNKVSVAFVIMVGLSVGAAIFTILELDGPLDGWIKVSSEPMHHALRHLDASLQTGLPSSAH